MSNYKSSLPASRMLRRARAAVAKASVFAKATPGQDGGTGKTEEKTNRFFNHEPHERHEKFLLF